MIFDAVVLAAVIISSVIAFLRGFIREVLTIIGVVGGLAAAYFGGPILSPLMHGWFGIESEKDKAEKLFDLIPKTLAADICAYGAIFIVVVLVLSVLSHFLAVGAKAVGLGPIDRIMGVLFGVARAGLLLCLLYLPINLLTKVEERNEWGAFKDSKSRPYIERGAEWISGFLPEETEKTVDDTTQQASEKMDETRKRLEDMEVLKNAADKAGDAMGRVQDALPPEATGEASVPAQDPGYAPEQRENMEELLNETTKQGQ